MKKKGLVATGWAFTLALLFGLLSGCGGGDGGGGGGSGNVPNKLADNVTYIDEMTSVQLSDTTGGTYTYDYTGSAPDINPEDILLSGEGNGYLRKVTTVNDTGTSLQVGTTQATLDEAFENLTIDHSQALTPGGVKSQQALLNGVYLPQAKEIQSPLEDKFYIQLANVVLYDKDANLNTTNDQVVMNGDITFKPDFTFQARIQGFSLQYLKSTITLNETANVEVSSTISVLSYQRQVEIARYYYTPITIPAGPVVVVLVPVLTVNVGINGEVSASITAEITQEATLTAGLKYENQVWSPISDFSNQFSYQPPSLTTSCSFKGYAGPQLNIMIYGVTGPYFNSNGYLFLDAAPLADPWWNFYAGLEANAGVKIAVISHLIASYEANLIDYRVLLASAPPYRYALVACADWAGQNSLAAIQLKPATTPRTWRDGLVNLGSDPSLDPVVRTNDLTPDHRAFVLQREGWSAIGLGQVALLNPANSFQVKTRYPVNNGIAPANPQDLLVLSSKKAYVPRYEPPYNDILILNPDTGATSGTIDFTGLGANADGLPRLYKMFYLQGRVWVLMQNINAFFSEYGPGAIGVVNPQTDALENIIALDLKNPADFGYDGELNRLYVAATGDWFDPSGAGVEAVNPASRTSIGVMIQGSDLGGFVTHMAFQDARHAYLSVTNSDFISGDQVIQVNPAAGTIDKTLYAYSGLYVSDLALDRHQNLLLIADNPGSRVVVMDLNSGLITDTIETLVPPVSIAIWEGEDKL